MAWRSAGAGLTLFAMQISTPEIALGGAAFIGGLGFSAAVISAVLVRIPPDWFVRPSSEFLAGHAAWVRVAGRLGKNLAGGALIALGIFLALPGIPGQGLLTMLLGAMLLDLPWTRALSRRLVRRTSVQHAINRIRARFGKPPIVVEPGAPLTPDKQTNG